MKLRGAALIMFVAASASPAAANQGARVVSVTGAAHAAAEPIAVGQQLPAGASLELTDGAVVQLLVGHAVSAGVVGPGRVRIAPGNKAQLALSQAVTARLAAAAPASIRLTAARVALGPGAVVLLHQSRLYSLRGQARVMLSAPPPGAAAGRGSGPTSQPTDQPGPIALHEGQVVRLSSSGVSVEQGEPPAEPRSATLGYAPPEPWSPDVSGINASRVRSARAEVERRQRRQREMAACGCTEGTTSGGARVQGRDATTRLERRGSTVRVKVEGMPKKIAR